MPARRHASAPPGGATSSPPGGRRARQKARRAAALESQARRREAPAIGAGSPPGADRRAALLLGLALFVVYNLNFRTLSSGDNFPARFLPFAVLEEGSLYLDSVLEETAHRHDDTYWILEARGGRKASKYPIVAPLLATPIYVPAWLYLRHAGWTYERASKAGELMEKVAGSCIASVTGALLFLALRRRLARRDALVLTVAFALGTNLWITGSQALWQHGAGALLVALALYAVSGEASWSNVILGGLAIGLLPANRPPDLLLAAGFAVYALYWARWRAVLVAATAACPVLLTVVYNLWMFEHPAGGYGLREAVTPGFFSGSILVGVAGLLVSPGKGLLVFSPFLLVLVPLLRRRLADRAYRRLTICLAAAAALQILFYATTDWRAGYSWGPRFLTDLLPILAWMLAPILPTLRRPARSLFAALVVYSIFVQGVGAFMYQGRSDILMYLGPGDPKTLAWRPWHHPAWVELHSGFAPMDLLRVFGVPETMRVPANWF